MLGGERDFGVVIIEYFEFSSEGFIAVGFAEDLGIGGDARNEAKSANGLRAGGVSDDLQAADAADEESEKGSFHDIASCSFCE